MPAPPLSVCTLDGVALKGASDSFQCPEITEGRFHTPSADFSQSVNTSCSPDNYVLLEAFRNTHFVYENVTLEWKSFQPECSIGIPGLSRTTTIVENTGSHYLEEGEVHPGESGEGVQLSAQVTSSFFILISIFFPSVTGECNNSPSLHCATMRLYIILLCYTVYYPAMLYCILSCYVILYIILLCYVVYYPAMLYCILSCHTA